MMDYSRDCSACGHISHKGERCYVLMDDDEDDSKDVECDCNDDN